VTLKLAHSPAIGKVIRQDDLSTLGVSSQTMAEQAIARGDWDEAAALAEYFMQEIRMMGGVMYTWMECTLGDVLEVLGTSSASETARALMVTPRQFDAGAPALPRALDALARRDGEEAVRQLEHMRYEYRVVHDLCVRWNQDLLTKVNELSGEEAVLESILRTCESVWLKRFSDWYDWPVMDRVYFTAEGQRAHIVGTRRRGDITIIEEDDRFVFSFDPCGSCGVMRRGDPETGRRMDRLATNQTPQPWTWFRSGVSWYGIHSPIAMEWIWMRDGRPPIRPHEGCDRDHPCRWYVYKDIAKTPAAFYERMGFDPPAGSPRSLVLDDA
jgi:hypothetical protein